MWAVLTSDRVRTWPQHSPHIPGRRIVPDGEIEAVRASLALMKGVRMYVHGSFITVNNRSVWILNQQSDLRWEFNLVPLLEWEAGNAGND